MNDILKDNKMTKIALNFGVGFIAAMVLFMVMDPVETSKTKLALGVGVTAIVAPLLTDLLVDKF